MYVNIGVDNGNSGFNLPNRCVGFLTDAEEKSTETYFWTDLIQYWTHSRCLNERMWGTRRPRPRSQLRNEVFSDVTYVSCLSPGHHRRSSTEYIISVCYNRVTSLGIANVMRLFCKSKLWRFDIVICILNFVYYCTGVSMNTPPDQHIIIL